MQRVAKGKPRKGAAIEPAEERRKRPRDGAAKSDWESITLRRVANRVRALEAGSSGWEEVALRNLRRRLKDGG